MIFKWNRTKRLENRSMNLRFWRKNSLEIKYHRYYKIVFLGTILITFSSMNTMELRFFSLFKTRDSSKAF